MKTSQRQRYADRIDRVLRHMESRIDDTGIPATEELAGVAAMSPFHFHRVFRLMTGESVGEAMRRIRLARALPSLGEGESVTRAAGESGYATPQGFARALRAQTGTTATAGRADAATLDALVSALRRPVAVGPNSGSDAGVPISIEIISVAPLQLLGLRNVRDYAELNAGYTALFEQVLQHVPEEAIGGIYGVPYDDPRFDAPATCRFDCALAIDGAFDLPAPGAPLLSMTLGGGPHLRLRHLGDYDQVQESIDFAYAAAIALHDREPADTPTFLHYLDDPEAVEETALRCDVHLPLAR